MTKGDDTIEQIAKRAAEAASVATYSAVHAVLRAHLEPGAPARTPGRVGGKRTQAQIEATAAAAERAILDKPGMIAEKIAETLNLSANDLHLPLRRLVDGARARREGHGRFARYYEAR